MTDRHSFLISAIVAFDLLLILVSIHSEEKSVSNSGKQRTGVRLMVATLFGWWPLDASLP